MALAPVVLFVYARPKHTQAVISALQSNSLASQTELVVFSDNPRSSNDVENVNHVRRLIHRINGFKKVTVIERDQNYGLARNIVDGITQVCNQYGKIIVLEDDILVSPIFLTYMNQALDRYEASEKVWHISGWNYPINHENLPDVFFHQVMNCWGWGTWQNRWKYFDKNCDRLIKNTNKELIHKFNLEGVYNFWGQVEQNHSGEINTWAVFWYNTIFEKDGLCLNPTYSYVRNIGYDDSGMHCGMNPTYLHQAINQKMTVEWPDAFYPNYQIITLIKEYLSCKNMRTPFQKLKRKIKRFLLTTT